MKPFILTFGSCGWDRIINKDTNELIYEEEGRKNSHQAVAAYRAGADSVLVSFVGDDDIGSKVLKSLEECGLDIKYITVVKDASTEINVQYWDSKTKDYELHRGPASLSNKYDRSMLKIYREEILKASAVNLVSKQPKEFLTDVIEFCYDNNISTYLTMSYAKYDLHNKNDLDILKRITNIAVNYQEACDLTKLSSMEKILKILPNMIITKGADGVWFCDENGKICHEPAVEFEHVVETNGAGDTFIGNFIVFRAEGKSITESVRLGMCASSIKISKMGVYSAMPYREDTIKLFNDYYNTTKNTI